MKIIVGVANISHLIYATEVCKMIEEASRIRGTGIAKREPEYIKEKIKDGKAVIATDNRQLVGFCYIESWEEQKFVANSGLIVHPDYRKTGLARKIKSAIFDLSVKKFPNAKFFGITTSLAVMKINSDLGYKPVTFTELTKDESFWKGCEGCVNHDILIRTNRKMCLCTGMVCDPSQLPVNNYKHRQLVFWEHFKSFLEHHSNRKHKYTQKLSILKKIHHDK